MESKIKEDGELSPELRRVAREGGTEPPFSGKYLDGHEKGMFKCAICGAELFSSDTKFDSGTGWPSFPDVVKKGVELHTDNSMGVSRIEVICSKCGGHLGHLFKDGFTDKGGKRYCINSVCLELEKK